MCLARTCLLPSWRLARSLTGCNSCYTILDLPGLLLLLISKLVGTNSGSFYLLLASYFLLLYLPCSSSGMADVISQTENQGQWMRYKRLSKFFLIMRWAFEQLVSFIVSRRVLYFMIKFFFAYELAITLLVWSADLIPLKYSQYGIIPVLVNLRSMSLILFLLNCTELGSYFS